MSWIKEKANDARANLAKEKRRANDRLNRLLCEFVTLTPRVKSCLKEFGDEIFGSFLGFPLYKYGMICDKRLEGTHCWWVSKRFKGMRHAAVCVYLLERMENNKPTGEYCFRAGSETKDTSEQELRITLLDCVEGVLRDIERYKPRKSSN